MSSIRSILVFMVLCVVFCATEGANQRDAATAAAQRDAAQQADAVAAQRAQRDAASNQ